jgi:hypothetical protein
MLVISHKANCANILTCCHDELSAGHLSFEKTCDSLKQVAWWPMLSSDAEAYVSCCTTCQHSERATGKQFGLLTKIESPSRPWDMVNMYFVTNLPPAGERSYNSVLVMVDRFSNRCHFLPTHAAADTKEITLLWWHFCWHEIGMPRVIISDRDAKFTSTFWKSLTALSQIQLAFSTAHHPQTDGLAERMIQTLEDLLRRYVAFGITYKDSMGFTHDWYMLLPALENSYNSAPHSTTERPPFLWRKDGPLVPLTCS